MLSLASSVAELESESKGPHSASTQGQNNLDRSGVIREGNLPEPVFDPFDGLLQR